MESLKIYKGKKVLITGHTGFKGGWLTIWLNNLGANVIGYALDPQHQKGIFNTTRISNSIKDYRFDIRNLSNLIEVFQKEKPEFVFHLAAQPLVLQSYKEPVETFEINIQGTVNILEAIRQANSVKVAVIITSDKCYENRDWEWGYRETDRLGGNDPYSASKGAAEIVISAYKKSFFANRKEFGIATARAGNVIGGGDWAENRLVPDIIRSLLKNKEIKIRNPKSTRPWQHVLEPLYAYLKLGAMIYYNPKEYSGAWNFGPYYYEKQTVRKVVEAIINNVGKGKWVEENGEYKIQEANLLQLDISKAINKLNWRPVLTFDEAIKMTTDWYFQTLEINNLNFSIEQIIKYTEKWKLLNGN